MNQRTAMIMAAALTMFVLVLIAGLVMRFTQTTDLAASAPTANVATDPATNIPTLDPTVEALVREREATYQAALTEANQRLAAANAQIAAANGQIAQAAANQAQLVQNQAHVIVQSPAAPLNPAPAAPTYAFSSEQAQTIALAAAPGTALLKAPELVSYEGQPAYEVRLDSGLVYVDAQTGMVAYTTIQGGNAEHDGSDD